MTELRRWRSFVAKRQREARCITTTTPFGARRRQRRRTLGSGDGRWLCGGRAANRTRRRLRRHGAPCRLALARLRAWVPPPPNRGWGRQGMVRRRKTARAFRWQHRGAPFDPAVVRWSPESVCRELHARVHPLGARSPAWCSHDDSSSWRPRASWRRVACLFVSRVHRWQHGWATDREAGSRPSRRRACYGGCRDPLPSGGRTMRCHLGETLRELALACCRLALHASQRACPFLAREPGSRRAIVSGSNAACPVTGQPQRFARPAATLGGSSGRIEPCRWKARGSRRVLQGEL